MCLVQGLGTSTAEEGQDYFKNIVKHKKDFMWVDNEDGEAIELAFSKKHITERKNWLSNFQVKHCIFSQFDINFSVFCIKTNLRAYI
jgi:DNA topoisomerase-2